MLRRIRNMRALDVLTFVVFLLALTVAVRPGSALYASTKNWLNDRRDESVIAERWHEMSEIAQKLYEGNRAPDIIEISDYECPFCRSASVVVDSAVQSGLKFALLHLPLSIHPAAMPAARAALCAGTVGRFIELHKFLMSSDTWRTESAYKSIDVFSPVSSNDEFRACALGTTIDTVLAAHMSLSAEIGALSTPTFVTRHGKLAKPLTLANLRAAAAKD